MFSTIVYWVWKCSASRLATTFWLLGQEKFFILRFMWRCKFFMVFPVQHKMINNKVAIDKTSLRSEHESSWIKFLLPNCTSFIFSWVKKFKYQKFPWNFFFFLCTQQKKSFLKYCYRFLTEHEKELHTRFHLLSSGSKASIGYTVIFTTSSMAQTAYSWWLFTCVWISKQILFQFVLITKHLVNEFVNEITLFTQLSFTLFVHATGESFATNNN